jgi:hypothetical protein
MTIQTVVDLLNNAFKSDPSAIHALMVNRVPCNEQLADDPFIVVETPPVLTGDHFQVGALGLINGVLGSLGMPRVALTYSDKDSNGRSKILGFTIYERTDN